MMYTFATSSLESWVGVLNPENCPRRSRRTTTFPREPGQDVPVESSRSIHDLGSPQITVAEDLGVDGQAKWHRPLALNDEGRARAVPAPYDPGQTAAVQCRALAQPPSVERTKWTQERQESPQEWT